MVQNRNWQKRVEDAEVRRQESKHRKRMNENKRLYKSWVLHLLRTLDENAARLRLDDNTLVKDVYFWVDTVPSRSPSDLFTKPEEESSKASRRRLRANSLEVGSNGSTGGKNGRRRANSMAEKAKKKHPRSRESFAEGDAGEAKSLPVLLCRSHFFSGKCGESVGKKANCRCFHYSDDLKTLHQVLNPEKNSVSRQELRESCEAADSAVEDLSVKSKVGAVDMIFYIPLRLKSQQEKKLSLSQQILGYLSNEKVALASIVYVALGSTLIFDRNRGGVQLTDTSNAITALVSDEKAVKRKLSIGSEGDCDEETFHLLPGTTLEHILAFLPDKSVAAASSVCKSWNREIGQKSPHLWRLLLERRNWPLPMGDASCTTSDTAISQRRFRDAFLRHYSVLRDAEAMRLGIEIIGSAGKKQCGPTLEMGYQDFSSIKHAPSEPNHCVAVHVWDANQILVAYAEDCSVRLFRTILKPGNDERGCKEMACQYVDPYRNTKKRNCSLLSVEVDEECIGCLCLVTSSFTTASKPVLVTIDREEFLLSETSGVSEHAVTSEANLNEIDIQDAVVNYIFSCDGTEMHELTAYVQEGGDIESVEVFVSPYFAACGYGRFMFEVSVSIPDLPFEDEDGGMHLLGRKLVIFSASAGAIVWMEESVSLVSGTLPRSENVLLSSTWNSNVSGALTTCSIAVSPQQSTGSIILLEIEQSGEVYQSQSIGCPVEPLSQQLHEEGWSTVERVRLLTLTSSHVVVADTLKTEMEDLHVEYRSLLSFLPRFLLNDDEAASICLEGMETLQISCVRYDYIIAMCRKRRRCRSRSEAAIATDFVYEIWAVLIHVPSRSEIGRILWLTSPEQFSHTDLVMANESVETLGVGLSWKGVVMTGNDVRIDSESDGGNNPDRQVESPKSKKKKKRKPPKSSRKDGFARGKLAW